MTNQTTSSPTPKPYTVKRKKRKRGSALWIAALILLLLGVGAATLLQEYLVFTQDGAYLDLEQKPDSVLVEDHAVSAVPQISPDAGPRVSIDMGTLPPEGAGLMDGALLEIGGMNAEEIRSAAAELRAAGYTAAVVPVKPADGARVSKTALETARAACDAEGLRLVAYISCFRDDVTAREKTGLALYDSEGNLFIDYGYSAWLDPDLEESRALVLEHCRFAEACGADELILDHLSYPNSGNVDIIAYPNRSEAGPQDVIAALTQSLRENCSLRMGAVLYGDDTFGEGASEEKGQDIALFLTHFERIWANAANADEAAQLYRQCTALSADAAHAFGAIMDGRYVTAGMLFE